MACHGDDGKGRDELGPTLIGSQFALAPPVVPIRILLQGKEGTVGIDAAARCDADRRADCRRADLRPPPVGECGAVGRSDTVKEVRTATAARTRPWTNDELLAIAGRGGDGGR